MTVGRAHRPARSRAEALDELNRLRGLQFDPRVVDAFERALVELEKQTAADSAASGGSGNEPAIHDAGR
jgi:HD-GYP domain-containing protein (c-di-GMP phosphodiesterase class II)